MRSQSQPGRSVLFPRQPSAAGAVALPALLLSGLFALGACSPSPEPSRAASDGTVSAGAAATTSDSAGEWEVLFDGQDLSRWRGFKRTDVPANWSAQDGTLAFTPGAEGGDLITRDEYGDFELEYDWKISEGGNSGVIYRSTEDREYPWQTGPEMQVLDDARHPDGQLPSHRAGALYDLIVPPDNITRPVGEWNHARIVVQGNHIQQWLNDQKTADVVIGSPEWNEMLAASKFTSMPDFATRERGHIVLQDHGDPVWYRDIRIRPLSESE